MLRRAEVRVPPQQDVPEARVAAQRDRLIEPVRRSLMRWAAATAVYQIERFAGVRQRHHQRVIAPHAVVGDPHAFLAFATRRRQRPVGFDDRLLEEELGLLLPHGHPHPIDRRHHGFDIRHAETTHEVAGRRWIGDRPCPERIQVHLVLAPLLEILQRLATAQDVVRDVQHVIRLVVGLVHLQHLQARVDRLDQSRPPRQQVHRSDPARAQTSHPIAALVLDIAAAEHWFHRGAQVPPPQPPLNPALATSLSLLFSCAHSKCPPWRFESGLHTTSS